ncbi:MAG: hypothetical protein V4692_00805, partial [Bdellovibrionota bacterium]
NRLAGELKKFDITSTLTPQARQRLDRLERRFRDVMKTVSELQKEVDSSFERFAKLVRKSRAANSAKAARGTAKKATRKVAKKATSKKAAGKRKAK